MGKRKKNKKQTKKARLHLFLFLFLFNISEPDGLNSLNILNSQLTEKCFNIADSHAAALMLIL